MNDAAKYPQLQVVMTSHGSTVYANTTSDCGDTDIDIYADDGFLWITVDHFGGSTNVLLSAQRETHLGTSGRDKTFPSLDAAMNYCLINGLLV